MEEPRVSIVMPTYNRQEILERAVKSVLDQTFRQWELIVVNDASTDVTKEFLDGLAHTDARVRPVHHIKNNYPDISGTLNEGLKIARGGYIARLDDDDYWCDNDKLKKQVVFLDANQDCVIAGGGVIVVDENDKERFRYLKSETDAEIRPKALRVNPFAHSTVVFRRDAALAVGGYGGFKNAEDWDLWLRMGLRGTFYNFQEYFVRYRMTVENKTFVFKRSQAKEILKTMRSHRTEYSGYWKASMVGMLQYIYSYLPLVIRRPMYGFSLAMKQKLFS